MSQATPGIAENALRVWVSRGLSLFCVGSLIPAFVMSTGQMNHMHPIWLLIVGGTITGLTLIAPITAFAWIRIRGVFTAYATVILIGVVTWPLAWTSGLDAGHAPWIWSCLPAAVLMLASSRGWIVGVLYAVVISVAYGLLRTTASGGSATGVIAGLDACLIALPTIWVVMVDRLLNRRAMALDLSFAEVERIRNEHTVESQLAVERNRLDSIVHDEIMTTLVSAAHPAQSATRVAEQARQSLEVLAQAGQPVSPQDTISAAQLADIFSNIVGRVGTAADLSVNVGDERAHFPVRVVRAVTRAAREALVNAHVHSESDWIAIHLDIDFQNGRSHVRVVVSDGGVGFDPQEVAESRLGIRLSLQHRMAVVGGTAVVWSKPNQGTTVTLEWTNQVAEKPEKNYLLSILEVAPFYVLMWVMLILDLILAFSTLITDPTYFDEISRGRYLVSGVLAIIAMVVVDIRRIPSAIPKSRAIITLVLMLVASWLAMSSLRPDWWPPYANWTGGVALMAFLGLIVRRDEVMAWVGTAILTLISVAYWTPSTWKEGVLVIAPVFVSMVLGSLAMRWVVHVEESLQEAEANSEALAQQRAQRAATTVLREVWLAPLGDIVIPKLQRLLDVTRPITDEERQEFLSIEAQLRDAIKARNLTSTVMSLVVANARKRGVAVTLVDNRGSELPLAARSATLKHLTDLAQAPGVNKIVVRTAPEGYPAAVTIVVGSGDEPSVLIRITAEGEVLEDAHQ